MDLDLAWARVRRDLSDRRSFVAHPFLPAVIESDPKPWLNQIREAIATEQFAPSPGRVCAVPKPHGHVRPGGDLHLVDQVVFAALVQEMRPQIEAGLDWEGGHPDYSYHLRAAQHVEWFEPHFRRWRAFDQDSMEILENDFGWAVLADIAGYYETVDLDTLRSDLNGLEVDREALTLLITCLNRWGRVNRRGLPQGYSPSDLLGKLYLHGVDLQLRSLGLRHKRWVDDYRIFCASETEARSALAEFVQVLGRRGLVVQSAKTKILNAPQARGAINEPARLLQPLLAEVTDELLEAGVINDPYIAVWRIDEALIELDDGAPLQILSDAYVRYFGPLSPEPFNKTLFHFLLSRLSAAGDPTHLASIIRVLGQHPEEFDYIARYAQRVDAVADLERGFVEAYRRDQLVLPYSRYQALRWRLRLEGEPTDPFLEIAREAITDPRAPWYLLSVARAAVGRWGGREELETLEHEYPNTRSEDERVEIICCLSRMERGRRNAFLGRAAGDGALASQAVRLVREERIAWGGC